ncbi:beta-ketoacyl-ACP synthase III [Desulfocurvus sp. DL9XJH121]
MKHPAYIRGFGCQVPPKILTNADLESMVDTSDEWITTRTGIKERHVCEGQTASDLASEAAKKALADAGMTPEDVTHIVCCTCTPDSYCPNAATQIQRKLGLAGRIAFDLNAACSGFLYGLYTARALVAADPKAVVLVAAVEILTSRTNWEDRTTCVLFGDGSGAAVVTREPGGRSVGIADARLASDGQYGDLLTFSGGGSGAPYRLGDTVGEEFFISMNGREVYKVAVRNMTATCKEVMADNGLTVDDIDWLVPHQANLRIIEAVGKKLAIPSERVFTNVQRYGNTSSASVGLALCEGIDQGLFKPGQRVLLTVFGGGFTWGAVLLDF